MLAPVEDLMTALEGAGDQILSRLYYAEQDALWAATAIADLYASMADLLIDRFWKFAGANASADPGVGRVAIANLAGLDRLFAISTIDADNNAALFGGVGQGSTAVLTDDPSTPPITTFRHYLITTDLTDHGTWVSFKATRDATYGTPTAPPIDSRVRLIFR
jgi:hypothetical protein